ncbi:hypothetical protein Tco_0594832 [Tanacetum coccineum]
MQSKNVQLVEDWYTKECCSIGNLKDQIIIPRGRSFFIVRFVEPRSIVRIVMDILPKSSNDNTNVCYAPREPSVVDQDTPIKPFVRSATQPEYLQELLQSLLEDLQILNEIQQLKQEIPNQIQKDQEKKSIAELLVEERLQKANQSDDFSLGECNLFDIDDSYYEKSTSRLAHLAPNLPEIVEVCVDDDDTDDDDDYDDDFYDCVDIEEDGGEIDFDISKIVDISLREKLVESYLLIEKINAFSLSPPIPISPIFCPSSTIPVVDLDLPLEEADVPSFSDDSMILPKYESFTFDDEPVMAEVNVFDEINTSELSYPGIGFPDFGSFMVQNLWKDKAIPTISIDGLQSSLHK